MTAIRFYSRHDDYSWLSNFSPHAFMLGGLRWPTVEHYFQAQKFHDEAYRERIRVARSPKDAKTLGRSRSVPLRSDWEKVKEDVMREALLAKFEAHDDLKAQLLNTKRRELIEASPFDRYWGCGRDGSGRNRLGVLLMELRSALTEVAASP